MDKPCPHCGRPTSQSAENRDRPFCTERCRMLDLGAWLSGDYVIPGPPAEVADEAPPRASDEE